MLAQPVFATTVQQTAQGSLGSVTEESQILPIPGENGKYILKSNLQRETRIWSRSPI